MSGHTPVPWFVSAKQIDDDCWQSQLVAAADLELPAEELRARILERRNAKAGVHYWERATHLLNKERFRSCR